MKTSIITTLLLALGLTCAASPATQLIRRMADGADMLRTAAACTTLGSGDEIIGKIISGISEEYTRDDVSLAVLASDTPEATAAAKAVLIERQKKSAAEAEEPTAETPEVPAEDPDRHYPVRYYRWSCLICFRPRRDRQAEIS